MTMWGSLPSRRREKEIADEVRMGRSATSPIVVEVGLIVFLVSFCTAFYATFVIIGALADRVDERELGWGERASRRMSRFGAFFLADEFRWLRKLYFSAWAGALGSMGLVSLLMFLFGKPA
jgi:hypothetical protein